MKNVVFWDVTPCGYSNNRLSENRIISIVRVKRIVELRTTLAVTSKIPEDGILISKTVSYTLIKLQAVSKEAVSDPKINGNILSYAAIN
jgi:hypothetical protein